MIDLTHQAQKAGLLWKNNPVFIQLIGLSPVLAVSSTLSDGIGLGLATLCICIASCTTASALSRYLSHSWRLLGFMLILATYTTAVETLLQLYFYPLSLRLGIYLPLICGNVAILLRMETVSTSRHWLRAMLDALQLGLGFLIALVLFSACRELLISGSVLHDWQLLLPTGTSSVQESHPVQGHFFRFADSQAGAFILLGLLVAGLNFLSGLMRAEERDEVQNLIPVKRARITGRLTREDPRESS